MALAIGWTLDGLGFEPTFLGMAAFGLLAFVGLLAGTAARPTGVER